MSKIIYNASPTLAKFHADDAFIRGTMGPVGSGKSVAMVMEMLSRGIRQKTWRDTNIRKTSWGIVRNTYDMLNRTTLRTFVDWLPEELLTVTGKAPIEAKLTIPLQDGTIAEMNFDFISCDKPKDIAKLKSFEITGLWINEAMEVPKSILDWGSSRVGRYPKTEDGGCTWRGVIMDTNAMDTDHWYYYLAEKDVSTERGKRIARELEAAERAMRNEGILPEGQSAMSFYKQPGALIFKDGLWQPNKEFAENIKYLDGGWAYYLRGAIGKSYDEISIMYGSNYGVAVDGKPVFPSYDTNTHFSQDVIEPEKGTSLIIGVDHGRTPAAVICQFTKDGVFQVVGEVCAEDMSVRTFIADALKPYLAENFAGFEMRIIGDPAGKQRSQADDNTCEAEYISAGFNYSPAKTNNPEARVSAVDYFMNRSIKGKPAFRVSACCLVVHKACAGGYHYRRVQVVGDERYTDEPDKNKYSHPGDALEYAALECGAVGNVVSQARPERSWRDKIIRPRNNGFMTS